MVKNKNRHLKTLDHGTLWHPFTQMTEYGQEDPIIIQRANGHELIDIDGKHYLDGVSSLWVNVHGHRKKEIDQAIKKQLNQFSHSTLLGVSHVPALELAEKLVKITPHNLTRVFYSDNGSTAVEIALKMAFQACQQKGLTKKKRFVCFENGYHGDTLGSVSVGGIDLFHEMYRPLLFEALKVSYPDPYHSGQGLEACRRHCLEKLEAVFREKSDEIAALIIEPLIQGAGGMIISPPGFLKGVRHLCTQYNVWMIADEVATGFGRTGKMFACDHEAVRPDFMTLAKGITGGYLPLAVTLTTEEVYQAFEAPYEELKTFFHGHSYSGNALACAAALANLKIFKKEKTLEKMKEKIIYLSKELKKFWDLPTVGDIRQKGFMVGIELVKDRETKTPYALEERIGHRVILRAREKGVILRPLDNVIVLMPPLSLTKRELSHLCGVTFEAIQEVTAKQSSR